MKLTQRGKNIIIIIYTIVITLLCVSIYNKYISGKSCVDKYTADILATKYLYGEGIDKDRATTAIYNNGGWIEIKNELYEEVIFPCVKNNKYI